MKKYKEHVNELIWNHNLKVQMNILDTEKPFSDRAIAKIEVEQDTAEKISNVLSKDKLNNGRYKVSWVSLEDLYQKGKNDIK